MRFYCLTCSSLWHDEGNTWALVQRSFAQIARDSAADIHPPGYYWLLKLWTLLLGPSAWSLRAFSALAGTLTVAVVYAIARTLTHISRTNLRSPISSLESRISNLQSSIFNLQSSIFNLQPSSLPLLAALIAAVSPFQIFYSQEARMYALLMLESSLLIWIVMKGWNADEADGAERRGSDSHEFSTHHAPRTTFRFATDDTDEEDFHGSEWNADEADEADRRGSDSHGFSTHHALRDRQLKRPQHTYSLLITHLSYSLIAAAGLWTHYIFPVLLAAIACAFLWAHLRTRRPISNLQYPISNTKPPIPNTQYPIPNPQSSVFNLHFLSFLAANLLALLLYLPWLPTAVERVLSWPAGGIAVGWIPGLRLTLQTLVVGPIRSGPELAWPWLVLAGALPLLGLWRLRRTGMGAFLALWLLFPVGLMFALGLFTEAFLKFLLVASPAWCLLTAAALTPSHPAPPPPRITHHALRITHYALPLLSLLLAAVTLPGYYADPAARDNYAGMARTVAALGDPATDLVILDAPGQQDVWRYYDPGVPVLALPRTRPPDPAQVEQELTQALKGRARVFALFWATDQADPQGLVEGFLDRNAFKGLESWQGNVRFVIYRLANDLACQTLAGGPRFDDFATLDAVCTPETVRAAPGEVLPVGLRWRALASTTRRYKITLQLLDSRSQVVAQRDAEPVGGSRPTDGWTAGETIADNHGVYVPPGAPPGAYRLILALYDSQTGQRLPVAAGEDHWSLGTVEVARSEQPLPPEIAPMQHRLNRRLGPVILAGYDLYKRGYAHAPQTPLLPGDTLHVTLYWLAPDPLPADWPDDLIFTLEMGEQRITAPLAGGAFPTGAWRAGDLVRGEFDLVMEQNERNLRLQVAGRDLWLGPIPTP